METVKRLFREWFTGKGNESFEIMRALTALCVLVMLVYIGVHLVLNKTFDPLASAGGLGALLFGGGAATAIKDGTKIGGTTTGEDG
ncbi:hypothetical protein D3Y57_07105 [Sphingomonas paeninsulae]|uniref:Uncharacterized protein n=2 Tax=Sphingomonas paeninsulae TaxID=2319844 RepID=A0A494TJ03_SPHPE|nr:hypothetical protein D3Y57_07105 [Sphingomonas paeninsulae]